MSALIWDSSSQAFKESEIPKVYSGGVWQDTEGKVWNGSAWVEAWTNGLVFFKNGILNNDVVMFDTTTNPNMSTLRTITAIDLTPYKTITIATTNVDLTDSPHANVVYVSKDIIVTTSNEAIYIDEVGTYTYDISHLNDTYYVMVGAGSGSFTEKMAQVNTNGTFTIGIAYYSYKRIATHSYFALS